MYSTKYNRSKPIAFYVWLGLQNNIVIDVVAWFKQFNIKQLYMSNKDYIK